jgi:thiol-disulfide isomerase/thioredoxin
MLLRTLVFGLLLLASASCSSDSSKGGKAYEPGTFTLTGNASNSRSGKLYILAGGQRIQIPVRNGSYSYSTELDFPKVVSLRHGRLNTELYMVPGGNLSVTYDENDPMSTIVFEGEGAAENVYYTKKSETRLKWSRANNQVYNNTYEVFKEAIDGLRETYVNLLNENKEAISDANFVALESGNIQAEVSNSEINYPYMYGRMNNNNQPQLPDNFLSDMKNIPLDNPQMLAFENTTTFIGQYLNYKAQVMLEKDASPFGTDAPLLNAKLKAMDEIVQDESIQANMLYSMIKEQIRYYGINGISSVIDRFNSSSTNEKQKAEINNLYGNWKMLAKGEPAPEIIAFDMSGSEMKLSDFKGRYVYVDVWATWCGPCKREIPFLENLQEQYHGNEKIAFASISVDKNKVAWEKMVKDKNLGGYQLHTTGVNHATLSQSYKIKGIPRFMLFDPEGKIVDVNAPRPSSKEIPILFESLFGKG